MWFIKTKNPRDQNPKPYSVEMETLNLTWLTKQLLHIKYSHHDLSLTQGRENNCCQVVAIGMTKKSKYTK